jgi:hypothetical protein
MLLNIDGLDVKWTSNIYKTINLKYTFRIVEDSIQNLASKNAMIFAGQKN